MFYSALHICHSLEVQLLGNWEENHICDNSLLSVVASPTLQAVQSMSVSEKASSALISVNGIF